MYTNTIAIDRDQLRAVLGSAEWRILVGVYVFCNAVYAFLASQFGTLDSLMLEMLYQIGGQGLVLFLATHMAASRRFRERWRRIALFAFLGIVIVIFALGNPFLANGILDPVLALVGLVGFPLLLLSCERGPRYNTWLNGLSYVLLGGVCLLMVADFPESVRHIRTMVALWRMDAGTVSEITFSRVDDASVTQLKLGLHWNGANVTLVEPPIIVSDEGDIRKIVEALRHTRPYAVEAREGHTIPWQVTLVRPGASNITFLAEPSHRRSPGSVWMAFVRGYYENKELLRVLRDLDLDLWREGNPGGYSQGSGGER